jgi:hypothetical protein
MKRSEGDRVRGELQLAEMLQLSSAHRSVFISKRQIERVIESPPHPTRFARRPRIKSGAGSFLASGERRRVLHGRGDTTLAAAVARSDCATGPRPREGGAPAQPRAERLRARRQRWRRQPQLPPRYAS